MRFTAFALVVTGLACESPHGALDQSRTKARLIHDALVEARQDGGLLKCAAPWAPVDHDAVQRWTNSKSLDRDYTSDPWGRTFWMRCTSTEVFVASAGADGKLLTHDDVTFPKP